MAFGNGYCQYEKGYPAGNNYCGGFALCAILNDINSEKGVSSLKPLEVYRKVQKKQEGLGSPLAELIREKSKGSETDICLPSSLARCAAEDYRVKNPVILYSKGWSMHIDVIRASCSEYMNTDIVGSDDWQSRINDEAFKYFLFLVQDDNHWIAVKHKDNGDFLVYDPADGNEVEKDKDEIVSYLMDTKNEGKPINLVIYFEK